jgi:hypothetical protein
MPARDLLRWLSRARCGALGPSAHAGRAALYAAAHRRESCLVRLFDERRRARCRCGPPGRRRSDVSRVAAGRRCDDM